MANSYDQMQVDIVACHERLDSDPELRSPRTIRHGAAHRILSRAHLYPRLVDAGLIRGWFDEFNQFWIKALGGRPLRLHDFFYLHSHYRRRFQDVAVEENAGPDRFLAAWQQPHNIYLLFGAVYRYALDPFHHVPLRRFIPRRGRVLEFGCGVAPVITSMIQAGEKGGRFTAADIRNFTFTCAKWRLKQHGVKLVNLEPFAVPRFDLSHAAILMMTVLEHLPNPAEVTEALLDNLEPGGVLVFDYILGEGTGLDTAEAVHERQGVLDLIASRCDVIFGDLKTDESMGLTVVRKR